MLGVPVLDSDKSICLFDRFQNGRSVQWSDGSQIYNLFLCYLLKIYLSTDPFYL
jgi:hypothetical protein